MASPNIFTKEEWNPCDLLQEPHKGLGSPSSIIAVVKDFIEQTITDEATQNKTCGFYNGNAASIIAADAADSVYLEATVAEFKEEQKKENGFHFNAILYDLIEKKRIEHGTYLLFYYLYQNR